ncbi:MAG: methylase domain protein [Solirubrobacterales bacterium]|nr:methylase domain protein [Solirubrobacterales bacterium]
MSWRIEQTDALTVLRELPDRWAQTCVTRPPRAGDSDRTLAILAEVRRVLRDDGTLWVLLAPDQLPLATELRAEGWTQQSSPTWTAPFTGERAPAIRPFLFTRERRHFYDAHTIGARDGSPSRFCVGASRQVRRVQSCLPAREHERRLQLVKRCILAGSSLLACGECGAPYRRTRPGENAPGIRRPTCRHNNPGGCCLVLDPFYDPAGIPTAVAALCTRRSFLGIAGPAGESR